MSDLSTLIARLERATGPDRELDVLIFKSRPDLVDERHCVSWCRMEGRTDLTRDDFIAASAPEYTASLDAALTLVPKGWALYRIDQYNDRENPAWGWGVKLRCYERPDSGMSIGESRHSIAHALVIAALKARQPAPPPQETQDVSECAPTLFGFRHAHTFEPRYETRPATHEDVFWTSVTADAGTLRHMTSPRYLGDICTRCGKWQPAPTPQEGT